MKMYSNDYFKNEDAVQKISKLCRDVAETNSIREVSDLILKWVAIKMYGGNLSALQLIQVVSPLLVVLEKKKVAWNDSDVDVIIYITREYLISCFFDGNVDIETIMSIYKLTCTLSSGDRIIRKILLEMKTSPIHKHLASCKRDGMNCSTFYKKYLIKICSFFIDYFSSSELLGEAAKISELKNDY